MDLFLIEQSALDKIEALMKKDITVSDEQIKAVENTFAANESGMPENMIIAGSNAQISVRGVLTESPNWLYKLFGGGNTIYSDIRNSITMAENNPAIKEIILDIDSPGGEATAGWIDTIKAIANTKKPITAKVSGLAASAAYGIASQADSVEAQNEFSSFGSIGVVTTMVKPSEKTTVDITSSNAPNKRPNPETDEGVASIRKRIDAMEKIFIDNVASGREVSAQTVKNDFGQGGVFLAKEAKKAGMIDSINSETQKTNTQSQTAAAMNCGAKNKKESNNMDLKELKASHPAVYEQAVALGVSQEKERVEAHLTMGEACGDMKIATAAIKDGADLTAKYQAQYMAANMNRQDKDDRADAEDEAAKVLDGVDKKVASKKDDEDKVAEEMAALTGFDMEGK